MASFEQSTAHPVSREPYNDSTKVWWQSELATVRENQIAYLRRHLPALREDHDDLVGDTLLALTRQISEDPSNYPSKWFGAGGPRNKDEKLYLYKLAMVILKRRIADLFRKRHRESQYATDADGDMENVVDTHAKPPDGKILLAKLLKVTLSILDELPVEDRDLIALTTDKRVHQALNPRDRKRLERIRKKLRNEISRRLGADVQDILTSL